MAKKTAISVSIFCFFAMALAAKAQQPADHHAGADDGVARAGVNGTGAPQCIHCPPPKYTKEARAVNYNGTVLLDITVTKEGSNAKVIKGPGLGLNEKALEQVEKWKMKPAIGQDGKPVKCRVQVEVTFHRYN